MAMVEAEGFIGVVAVNSELEFARYLRPGDLLTGVQVMEDVSEQKQTGLGVGHFITSRTKYSTVEGEHVGDLLFRILKFRPGTGTQPSAPAADTPRPPDASPSLRPRPAINRDNQVLWDGYRKHELRVPQCQGCRRVFFPPSPRCAACGSFDMGYVVSDGTGTVYSHVAAHYPQAPGFAYPVPVALVELDPVESSPDRPRMVADLVGVSRDQVEIGMRVEVDWLDSHPALVEGATDSRGPITLPRFRPATPERRTETLTVGSVSEGHKLPLWVLPITPTRIVAGALATRDFQDVHHDRDLAHKKGSADTFLNINTSMGYMERYVSDWAGPEAVITALRVKLGAPAYPYNPLTFSGSVASVDPATGRTVVEVAATNKLGRHVAGTVELELNP
jgi:uncharacterized OB-fold protein